MELVDRARAPRGSCPVRRPRGGLPGIATNLLIDRLRDLEQAGVVQREVDVGSNGVVYALTPWGSELRDSVEAMVRWSKPLMIRGPRDDSFQPHWLAVALPALLRDRRSKVPATVGVDVDDSLLTVHLDQVGPTVMTAGDHQLETVLRAEAEVVLGLAAGLLTVDQAVAAGSFRGKKAHFTTVFGAAKL